MKFPCEIIESLPFAPENKDSLICLDIIFAQIVF
jgi:hypothetical protein